MPKYAGVLFCAVGITLFQLGACVGRPMFRLQTDEDELLHQNMTHRFIFELNEGLPGRGDIRWEFNETHIAFDVWANRTAIKPEWFVFGMAFLSEPPFFPFFLTTQPPTDQYHDSAELACSSLAHPGAAQTALCYIAPDSTAGDATLGNVFDAASLTSVDARIRNVSYGDTGFNFRYLRPLRGTTYTQANSTVERTTRGLLTSQDITFILGFGRLSGTNAVYGTGEENVISMFDLSWSERTRLRRNVTVRLVEFPLLPFNLILFSGLVIFLTCVCMFQVTALSAWVTRFELMMVIFKACCGPCLRQRGVNPDSIEFIKHQQKLDEFDDARDKYMSVQSVW